jgi:CPA2 family monovalent cation:H+ antiporter-2
VVGASAAAAAAGLSMALGAFLAGLLLAETEYRHEIEIDVEPFKGLLLGLFFVTVGIQIDIGLLLATPLLVFISIAALLAAKTAIIIPLVKLFGLDWRRAIEAGFLLAPAGEFAFVILAQASGGGLLPKPAADHLLLVVALSIFVTPLMATAGSWLAQLGRGEPDIEPQNETAAQEGHVVIAGFGRVGRMLASLLDAQGFNYVALDADAERVRSLRKAGWRVHFGDANRKEMLAAVGCVRASAIAVTMDSAQAVERVVAEVHRSWPGVPIFARARDGDQALRLLQIGARKVTPEAVEAALQLGEALLNQLGVPDEAARRIVNDARAAETFRIVDGSSRSV